ncbi:hypothetical protein BT96DRAFT_114821 [Gymnopus androsaceus JB14]|uniref:Uncharacterized protein n=1 Tax=Gymnopus androsaceus JB14 TaxID=1447944 RepID=A0A6A4HF46_9AGAR|nr:hypothetical protein BT96DRAFT_114821 [Gymnopus androsaceus JB14]
MSWAGWCGFRRTGIRDSRPLSRLSYVCCNRTVSFGNPTSGPLKIDSEGEKLADDSVKWLFEQSNVIKQLGFPKSPMAINSEEFLRGYSVTQFYFLECTSLKPCPCLGSAKG